MGKYHWAGQRSSGRWMRRGGLRQNRAAKTEAAGIVRVLVRQGDQTDLFG